MTAQLCVVGAAQRPPPHPVLWSARALLRLRWAQCRALLRNRYDSAPLVVGAALLVGLATADLVYQWAGRMPAGCDRAFFLGVGVPRGCEPAFHVSVGLTSARLGMAAICLVWVYLQRVAVIHPRVRPRGRPVPRASSRCQCAELPTAQRTNSASDGRAVSMPQPLSDVRVWGSGSAGWAVASSKQSWLEATGAVYSSLVVLLTVTLGVTSMLAVVIVVMALTGDGWRSGISWDYACATCSDGTGWREAAVAACVSGGKAPLNMCFLAWHSRLVFPYLVAGQVVSLGLLSVLTPLRFWDAIAVEAGEQTGLRWLKLLRVLHLLIAPAVVHVALPLVTFSAMEFQVGPRLLLEVAAYGSIIFTVAQLGLAVWLLWTGHQQQTQIGTSAQRRAGSLWQYARQLPGAIPSALLYESASGLNSKLMYVLVLIVFIFSAHLGAYGPAYYAVLLTVRTAILAVFLLTRDQPAGFQDLRRDPQGAGFGLVVDTCHLRETLRSFLEGHAGHTEPLPTYKATVYRMEATMAVSYRWQGAEASVCPGLCLNMSRWQMEQLVAALAATSCFYVWIDRLSVPQVESELQNTLLSRMMATYASARETLVLRSREGSGSRYHERAWTLPEFVCSASPRTCTEHGEAEAAKAPEAWPTDALISHTKAEEALVVEIREHYVAHLAQCRPLWLHPDDTLHLAADFDRTWELFERVLGLLRCSVAEDRIRAVYPLLFNTPVENHEELVVLVGAVADAMEARAPQSAASQQARRHYHEIMGAAMIDEDEVVEVARQRSVLSYTTIAMQRLSTQMTSAFHSGRSAFLYPFANSAARSRQVSFVGRASDSDMPRVAQMRRQTSGGVPAILPGAGGAASSQRWKTSSTWDGTHHPGDGLLPAGGAG